MVSYAEKVVQNAATKLYGLTGDISVRVRNMVLSIKYDDEPLEEDEVEVSEIDPNVKQKVKIIVTDTEGKPIEKAIAKFIGSDSHQSRPTGKKGGATVVIPQSIYEVTAQAKGYSFVPIPKMVIDEDREITLELSKV